MRPIIEVVYDAEIIKAIAPKNAADREEGIHYCEGWEDFSNMGVSVLCAYDVQNQMSHVFTQNELHDFLALCQNAKVLIGFNTVRFDNKLLQANGIEIPEGRSCDLLRLIWQAKGLNADVFIPKTHGGYKLDAVSDANLSMNKIGNGALAPVWWQRGQIGKVITYCLRDVYLTWQLYEKAIGTGYLVDPKFGGFIDLRSVMEDVRKKAGYISEAPLDYQGSKFQMS